MHDLKEALKQWKRSYRKTCGVEDLEELESHLLEHIEDLRKTGLSEEEAFAQAISRMGSPKEVGREFAKVRSPIDWVLDRLRALDLPLLLALLLISVMGLSLMYTMSDGIGAGFWIRQAVWFGLGFFLMLLIAQIKPAQIKRCAPYAYGISILLLTLLPFVGTEVLGAQRWLRLGPLTVQPSVLVLLTVPMVTAWLQTKANWSKNVQGFAAMLGVIILPTLLILIQPDVGMALLCLGAGWITLFLTNFRARLVRLTLLALPVLCATGWFLFRPYQFHWLGPETITQERHTDFILRTAAEQFGSVGVLVMLALFGFLFYRAMSIAKRSRDPFCRCLGLGFVGVVVLQLTLSVGAAYGMMPIIELPMPLVSYGGSSVVLLLVGFGILASIQRHQQLNTS